MSEPSTLACAVRALRKQFVEFRFEYPLETVPNCGTKTSLAYYLYSDRLSWEALRLDADGIPQTWFRMTGRQYWPSYVAWYGLVHLGHYLHKKNDASLDIFLKQVRWLERHAVVQSDGSVVWTMNFDYPVGTVILKSPWVSAHAQGLCISAVTRAWRLTRDHRLKELLLGSSKVFTQDHRAGGIRIGLNAGALYTEVPGGPQPGILDGFLTGLLGLHDLFIETGDPQVKELFDDGVIGLKTWLPRWDYRGKWSWYGGREYLCSPAYHCLNRLLLIVLSEVTGDVEFAKIAASWNPDRLNALGRAEIYLTHNWTHNVRRIRYRTWRLRQSGVVQPAMDQSGTVHSSY